MVSSLYVEVPGEPPFEVRLDKDVISVGRAEENVLGLRDMNVSRNHFSIERREQGWLLRDRGSRNGTLVNGTHVYDKILRDGDRIEVGGSALTFRAQASKASIATHEAPRPKPGPVHRESGVIRTTGVVPTHTPGPILLEQARPPTPPVPTTPRVEELPEFPVTPPAVVARAAASALPQGGARFGQALTAVGPKPVEGTPPRATTRPGLLAGKVDRWRKLAELTAAINQEHDLKRLLDRIVDAVSQLVGARGAFLVLRQGDKLSVEVARNLERSKIDDPNGSYRLSWQICKEAIATKRPVLTRDAEADTDLAEFASVANLKLKALLVVPFGIAGEVLGVVYLDEPTFESGEKDQDLIELVAAFGDLAGIAFANARHIEEVKKRERLSEELRIASRIQRKLLPESAPRIAGLEIAGRTIPAEEVGGDVYDFFAAPGGDLFISVGDVSGKGAGAGIVMASVRALLRVYAEREARPDRLLVAANHALVRDLERGNFVSLLLLRWSPATRTLTYAGAGHEHLIVWHARTRTTEAIRSGGVVLGLSPDIDGRVEEKTLALEPGDLLVLYTDGATEAATPEGEELGLERLEQVVREIGGRAPGEVVEQVIARVKAFAGEGHPLRDDLTVVALRRTE